MRPAKGTPSAKEKLLDAALRIVRAKGYAATTVDDLCAEAGVTKGAFFHHFESKEDLAVSATQHWTKVTDAVFQNAAYQRLPDPFRRLRGYVEFRKELLRGDVPEFTCLVGTMVQEAFDSNPKIREACEKSIFGHARDVARDVALAKEKYLPRATWSEEGLANHIVGVIQGAFILAKAKNDSKVAAESIDHLLNYLDLLFHVPSNPNKKGEKKNGH